MKRRFLMLLALMGWLAALADTQAASTTINWTGSGADTNWGTAGNWASTLKTGVSLNFSGGVGTSNINNVSSLTLDSVTINASSASWNISGQPVSLTGSFTTSGANTVTWNVDTKLASSVATVCVGGGNTTFSGVISGAGRLSKSGAGTLILGASNTYSGGTLIRVGAVQFTNVNAFGSGTISITANGGTIMAGVSGTVANSMSILSSVAGYFSTRGNNVTLTGAILGGILCKVDDGALVLTNANNSQSETRISGGTLEYAALGALSTGAVGIYTSGTLRAGISGTLSNTIDVSNGVASVDTQGYEVGFAGNIVDSGTLLKFGSGTLSIGQDNSATAGAVLFSIREGTLRYDNVGAFGGGTVGFCGNSTLRAGVAGDLSVAALNVAAGVSGTLDTAGLAVSSTASLTGSGTLVIDGNGSLLLRNAVHSISGGLIISSGTLQLGDGTSDVSFTDAGLSIVNNGAILYQTYTSGTIAGNLSGIGALMVSGPGVLVLNGSNSFTGSTQVRQAELDVNGSYAGNISIGTGGILGGCGTVGGDVGVSAGTIHGRGGRLNLGKIAFDGASTIAGGVGARTVVISSGTASSASVSDLTVSGTMTVKSGAVYVNSGTTSAPAIVVEKGAVFTNGGAVSGVVNVSGLMNAGGTVEGSLVIRSTGELAFGTGYGTTTLSGSLVVESGAKISMQIGGNMPGVLHDQIVINNGSVTLGQGSILSLSLNGAIDSFVVLIDNRGTLQISGTFSTVLIGEKVMTLSNNTFLYNGVTYQLIYNVDADGDGRQNDVELSVVPEPAVGGLMVVGLGVLARRAWNSRNARNARACSRNGP